MSMIMKGILIGMFVSIPIGPLGIITIQRTINSGWKRGFLSGLGAASADIVFSSAAVYGVSYLHHFINKHENLIDKIVGVVFFMIGMKIFTNFLKHKEANEDEKEVLHPTLSNFLLGLLNPGMFLIFLMLFAKTGIVVRKHHLLENIMLVASIFTGAGLFWLVVSNVISSFRRSLKIELIYQMNRIAGIMIALFGIYNVVKGFLKF